MQIHISLKRTTATLLFALATAPRAQTTDQTIIERAMSAAPPSIASNAAIMNWPDQPGGALELE